MEQIVQIEMPRDINAEKGIICTLIMYPNFILQADNLKAKHFYDIQNGTLYWAIQELINKGIEKIDDLNLLTQINSNAATRRTMGNNLEQHLTDLVTKSELLTRSTIEEYKNLVNRVIALGFKRNLYREIKKIESNCLTNESDDIADLNIKLMDTINSLAVDYITDNKIEDFSNRIDTLWDKLVSSRNPDGTFGIRPKWKILASYFTYRKGELTLICARQKEGKSVVALNETVDKLKAGLAVTYFDTEMQDDLFFSRLLSHITQIDEHKILSGNYTAEEETMIENAKVWIKKQKLVHEYNPEWTKDMVVTQAKILHNQGKCDFFIYDYIKDTSDSNTSSSDQYNELGNWANVLKNKVCGALDIPGITFAQLNREMKIADSDKIGRYVTTGITWRRKTEEEYLKDGKDCGNYALSVDFNRIGGCHQSGDYIDFMFRGNVLTIEACKKQHSVEVSPFV